MIYSLFQILTVVFSSVIVAAIINYLIYHFVILPKITQLKSKLPNSIASYINQNQQALIPLDKITNSNFFDKNIEPLISTHIDVFINEKLTKEIPMLSMFVGSKTIDKVKEVFVENVRELFPNVITQYVNGLLDKNGIKTAIQQQLQPVLEQQTLVYQKSILNGLLILGMITGLIISIVNLLILLIP